MLMRLALVLLLLPAAAGAGEAVPTGAFAFSFTSVLPAAPDAAWDAATGDILGWWDHSMSGDPHALEIQARPGGLFLETFDASGDGVAHAVVTYAKRREMLRMEGPMGLAGHAIHMTTTWTFVPGTRDGTTDLTVSVHAAGEVHEGWPAVVEATWRHFIDERLVPYLAGELGP